MRMLIFLVIIWLLIAAVLPARSCGVVVPARGGGSVSFKSINVAIGWTKGRECIIAQGKIKVDSAGFVWLIPTPSKPDAAPFPRKWFDNAIDNGIYDLTAPRRTYWLNSKAQLHCMWSSRDPMYYIDPVRPFEASAPAYNTIEPNRVEVLLLRSEEELDKWLRSNGYSARPSALCVLRSCIKRGWTLTAVRISKQELKRAVNTKCEVVVSAVQMIFPAARPVYPPVSEHRIKASVCVLSNYRMDFPGLHANCVLNRNIRGFYIRSEPLVRLLYLGGEFDYDHYCILSKFAGELKKGDMLLRLADSDDVILPLSVPAPLLENIGALLLLGLYYLTLPLLSCVIFPVAGSILSRRAGHPAGFWRVVGIMIGCLLLQMLILGPPYSHCTNVAGLVGIVIIVVAASGVSGNKSGWRIGWGIMTLLAGLGFILPPLASGLLEETTGYWPVGIAAIFIAFYFVFRIIKSTKREAADSLL